MSDLGEPIKRITVEPIELPEPLRPVRAPAREPQPAVTPDPERAPVGVERS